MHQDTQLTDLHLKGRLGIERSLSVAHDALDLCLAVLRIGPVLVDVTHSAFRVIGAVGSIECHRSEP
jgi:hypothetical protein